MKKYATFLIILAVAASFTACFSPWTGDSSITINMGRSMGRYFLNSSEDIEAYRFEYIITLRGPGGTITKNIKEQGPVTFQVVPGNWTVDIRAIGDSPYINSAGGIPANIESRVRMLRALAIENVEVKAGANNSVVTIMESVIEVSDMEELKFAIDQAKTSGVKEIIVLKNVKKIISIDDTLNVDSIGGSFGYSNVTIISDNDIILQRSLETVPVNTTQLVFTQSFFIVSSGATLTLGLSGMAGTITLSGGSNEDYLVYAPLISVIGGTVEMNEGVILEYNYNISSSPTGGGVNISSGEFTMKGGTIRLNEAINGGGVYLGSGIFNMSGRAVINNNIALSGGGVSAESGEVTMNGNAAIINNKANGGNGGGGVYLGGPLIFNMYSGSIKNNTASIEYGPVYGGGVYNILSTFYMRGGSITKNKIIGDNSSHGAGYYGGFQSNDNMTKSIIEKQITGNYIGNEIAPLGEQYYGPNGL